MTKRPNNASITKGSAIPKKMILSDDFWFMATNAIEDEWVILVLYELNKLEK